MVRPQPRAGWVSGCTSTTPTTTRLRSSTTRFATPGSRWASTRRPRQDCPGRCAPPTGVPNGRLTGWSGATSRAALEGDGRVTTGATALLVAGLTIRREATGDTRYDDVLRRLGRFVLAQAEPSGAVLASYDPVTEAPVAGEYSKYYTGEAYWALARLHHSLPGRAWGDAADTIGAYLATSRDEVEDHWPPIPDHWAAYGMSETVEFPERGREPLTDQEVDYARRQAELFGIQARLVSQGAGPHRSTESYFHPAAHPAARRSTGSHP